MAQPQDLFRKKEHVCGALESLLRDNISNDSPRLIDAANVPFVRNALTTVDQIVSLAQSVKSAKMDCRNLASRCLDLLSAISEAVERSDCTEEANRRLAEHAQTLNMTLQSVVDTITKIKKTCLVLRIISSSKIKNRIRKRKFELETVLELFTLQTIIDNNLTSITSETETANRTDEELIKISENVSRIVLEFEDEITKTKDSTIDVNVLKRNSSLKPGIFYGREEYVAKVVKRITSDSEPPMRLPILGPGGIGKTSVASAIIDDSAIHREFGQHRYFIKCSTFLTAEEMLRVMCQLVIGSESLKSDATDILESLLQGLKAARRVLFVLDNFETVWDVDDQQGVRSILGSLFQVDCLTLLITMMGSIPPAGFHWSSIENFDVLPALDLENAKKTFLSICPNFDHSAENIADLPTLLTKLDCIPLAVCLVAQMAYVECATPKDILANISQHVEMHREDPDRSVKASVSLLPNSYVVRDHPGCIDVLKIIAYLPGGVTSESVAQITHNANSKRLIAALLTAGLVHREGTRFNTLSPIRLYMEDAYPLDEDMQQDVFEYYFRVCADVRVRSARDAPEIKAGLNAEKTNCLKVLLNAANSSKADNRHLSSIIDFSWFLYYTIPSLELLQLASKEFESCSDFSLVAEYYLVSGETYGIQGNYKEARELLNKAKVQFSNIGNGRRAAYCLSRLGNIAQLKNNLEEAKRMHSEARGEFTSLGDKLGAAQCLRSLGEIARLQDNVEEEKRIVLEVRGEFDSVGNGLGVAQCLKRLGEIARAEGNFEEARKILSEAKEQFASIGNRLDEAQCIESLGLLAMDRGEYCEETKQMLLQAKSIYEVIDVPLDSMRCQDNLDELMLLMGESADTS